MSDLFEELADHPARQTIATELDKTLIVEAAAGTGKTSSLVARIIEVIRTGRGALSGMVAVTFTEKAAGELKLRLRAELEKARAKARSESDPAASERLDIGLEQLEQAHIGTIHGFCADLLKERPLQAQVDPLFTVASEEEKNRFFRREFDSWLEEKLQDPPEGVRRVLRHRAQRDWGPIDTLYRTGQSLVELRDFPTPWEIRTFDRKAQLDDLVEHMLRVAEMVETADNPNDKLFQNFSDMLTLVEELKRFEASGGHRDYDYLEDRIPHLNLGRHKGRGFYGASVAREDLLAEREALRTRFQDFRRLAGADLAAHLQNEFPELVERYQSIKLKTGRIDFLDLLIGTRDLIRDNDALRSELQKRFTHVFVDEFQDTDPLQAEILLLLCAEDPKQNNWLETRPTPGKLFIVADPKQSIYRFRRADVALYERIKAQLVENGAEALYLSVSFRSVPEIQEFVNIAMADAMKPSELNHQARYVPLREFRDSHAQPSVVALPIPRPYSDWGNVTQWSIQKSEPTAVTGWVKWLLESSGWQVTRRGRSSPQPVQAADICLLFRRFVSGGRDITRPYVDGLQSMDIPHVLVGGRGFHQREEIAFMRTALSAIERPDDELSIFATLRGPLFSLGDESLLLFRQRYGSLHPFRQVEPSEDATPAERDLAQALSLLARLHKQRNYRPIALTIRELLDATRSQAGFALWQSGDQVLANVTRLLQLARNFESTGGLSFRGFVQQLENAAEKGEQYEQPMIEDGVDGVRIMTVHRAKGLEFPVVILCDITCPLSTNPSRRIDPEKKLFAVRLAGNSPWELLDYEDEESAREEAESLRLLYVAATRARDILAIPAVADVPTRPGWLSPFNRALFPNGTTYRLPLVEHGVPQFSGMDTVVDRPVNAPVPPGGGIRPGLHKPQIGAHKVLWWDPELFENESSTKPGIRRHAILQARPGAERDEDQPDAVQYRQWREAKKRQLELGAIASHTVVTATEMAKAEEPEPLAEIDAMAAQIQIHETVRSHERPSGKAFGSLVHELLSRLPLGTESRAADAASRAMGRILGNTEAEIIAAAKAVSEAQRHPLMEKAHQSQRDGMCWQESPLTWKHGDRLIEGVADLVFRTDDQWHVVDFKTDVRTDIGVESYRRQVAIYARAIEAASGATVHGHLLYV